MSSSPQAALSRQTDSSSPSRALELHKQLKKLEQRDWWLWSMAVCVMLLLTFAVFALSFPKLISMEDPFFQAAQDRAVRGLAGLVLIFNAYTIYQQVKAKRLRSGFSKQLEEMRILEVRAEEFERLAHADALTGLPNRRAASQRLTSEASRSERYGHSLTVVAIDLDKFKQINDTCGHAAGDLVLKEFGRRLSSVIRLSDFAARMGGDEFLVLLPECTTSQVGSMLARLRHVEIALNGKKIPIQFSAGWVGYEKGETTEQFLERADQILYAEKRAGKRRVQEPTVVA